eukprot:m.44413 g.44413  ORF g.44413 m.44413 type:complete len:1303 (+) comp5827_c0_seq1:187-4095(+)
MAANAGRVTVLYSGLTQVLEVCPRETLESRIRSAFLLPVAVSIQLHDETGSVLSAQMAEPGMTLSLVLLREKKNRGGAYSMMAPGPSADVDVFKHSLPPDMLLALPSPALRRRRSQSQNLPIALSGSVDQVAMYDDTATEESTHRRSISLGDLRFGSTAFERPRSSTNPVPMRVQGLAAATDDSMASTPSISTPQAADRCVEVHYRPLRVVTLTRGPQGFGFSVRTKCVRSEAALATTHDLSSPTTSPSSLPGYRRLMLTHTSDADLHEMGTTWRFFVSTVGPDSPASVAELRVGDMVVSIDDHDLAGLSADAFGTLLAQAGPSVLLGVCAVDDTDRDASVSSIKSESAKKLSAFFGESPAHLVAGPSHDITKRGTLDVKIAYDDTGKRHKDRRWCTYTAVLRDQTLLLFDPRQDVLAGEEPVGGRVGLLNCMCSIGYDYKRKKREHVFHVHTSKKTEYLMQAISNTDMMEWHKAITAAAKMDAAATTAMLEHLIRKASSQNLARVTPSRLSTGTRLSTVDLEKKRPSQKLKSTKKGTDASLSEKIEKAADPLALPLREICERYGAAVPPLVTKCIAEVDRRGLEIEGIYRLAGSVVKTRCLWDRFGADPHGVDLADQSEWDDIHIVTGLLKQYVRELPGALIDDNYRAFIAAASKPVPERPAALAAVVATLPDVNRATLRVLIAHLIRVTSHSAQNKMDVRNIATVLGPTIIRPIGNENVATMFTDVSHQYGAVEVMILNFATIFGPEMPPTGDSMEMSETPVTPNAEPDPDTQAALQAARDVGLTLRPFSNFSEATIEASPKHIIGLAPVDESSDSESLGSRDPDRSTEFHRWTFDPESPGSPLRHSRSLLPATGSAPASPKAVHRTMSTPSSPQTSQVLLKGATSSSAAALNIPASTSDSAAASMNPPANPVDVSAPAHSSAAVHAYSTPSSARSSTSASTSVLSAPPVISIVQTPLSSVQESQAPPTVMVPPARSLGSISSLSAEDLTSLDPKAGKGIKPVTGGNSMWLLTEFDRLVSQLSCMSTEDSLPGSKSASPVPGATSLSTSAAHPASAASASAAGSATSNTAAPAGVVKLDMLDGDELLGSSDDFTIDMTALLAKRRDSFHQALELGLLGGHSDIAPNQFHSQPHLATRSSRGSSPLTGPSISPSIGSSVPPPPAYAPRRATLTSPPIQFENRRATLTSPPAVSQIVEARRVTAPSILPIPPTSAENRAAAAAAASAAAVTAASQRPSTANARPLDPQEFGPQASPVASAYASASTALRQKSPHAAPAYHGATAGLPDADINLDDLDNESVV